jgi:uncharacterized membrane protein YfcA
VVDDGEHDDKLANVHTKSISVANEIDRIFVLYFCIVLASNGCVLLVLVGLGVGLLYGLFGAGGSAFATPFLALVGVPPVLAVASPLPATIPAALAGAWSYRRAGPQALDLAVARRALLFGAPASLLGALSSRWAGGQALLLLSGGLLLVVGVQVTAARSVTPARRAPAALAVGSAAIGFSAGLLANSGGFLLVPFFLLAVGLDRRQAAATSLVVAAALTVPTALMHIALGHVDWRVAGLVGLGLVPGSVLGSRLSSRAGGDGLQTAFGVTLVAFAVWFIVRTLTRH